MDDVSRDINNRFILNTHSFTKNENLILIQILKNKFNLDYSLHFHNKKYNRYRIYIKTKSIPDLKNLIYPYFHESLLYKLK
jgi:LAGLIDADG DNA endonuclease family.